MREIAYAKVNLALHVRAREADGYHRIETVFAFCEDGDGLDVTRSDDLALTLSGPFADALSPAGGEDNLVMRAAAALRDLYRVAAGAAIRLEKVLPVAAGLGGGSADAAAALRLLVRFWRLPEEPRVLHAIARNLGADVPACLASRTVRGDGRGDDLRGVDGSLFKGRPILLVNPNLPLATGPVFKAWDGIDRGALGETLVGRNDLEAPARRLVPVIGDVLDALSDAAPAMMSGSGATCFGLYPDLAARDAAATRIAAARPDWWMFKSRLR